MSEIPDRLAAALADRYRLERRLGAGGMATVYLAHDPRHDRKVAIKVLRPELAAVLGTDRFLHEIKVTANLQHPHILPLFDSGEADSFVFYVMPFVTGESLRDKLDREQRLGLDESLAITRAVAAALHYAHRHHIVHRDIKPDNVMLSDGLPVVADFGIARALQTAGQDRLTMTGLSLGTPAYMSPEQAGGDRDVDGRTDVYALGCMAFEMLAGAPPYAGPTALAIIAQTLTEPVPSVRQRRPEVPAAVDAAIRRAMAKEAADRFATAAAFAAALTSGSTGPVPVAADAPVAAPRREPFVGRTAERARLDGMLERARHGHGGLVLLGGEPGVGKTRLASEILADGRERGMLALTGPANEDETAPFILATGILEEVVRQLPRDGVREVLGADASELSRILPELRKLFPDVAAPEELPPEHQQRVLFGSFLEFLLRAAARAPLVVLLDDIHWADESSLKLLEHVAPRLGETPILVLGTYRDAETEMGAPFTRTFATLVRQRLAERLTVDQFDRQAVAELLAARGGSAPPAALVDAIHRGTEGNAFFVEEVFRHLSEEGLLFDDAGSWRADFDPAALDVPEGVRLVTRRRLERLAENTRSVLTMAAGIGLRFELSVLEAAAGDADKALDGMDEAESAQLVLPSGHREARYEFAHALVRQTLLEELSAPRRQRLHQAIADAMEAAYGERADERAADIAHQLHEAGGRVDAPRTRRYLALAGSQALAAAAAEEAKVYFDRALELEAGLGEAERARLLLERGNANRTRGDLEAATADWQAAVPLLEAAGLPVLAAGACWQIAWKQMLQGRLEESETYSIRGLESAGDGPSLERSRLLAMLGHVESHRANFERADELLSEAVAMAEELRDERVLGLEVLFSRIYQYEHTARVSKLVATSERAIELARRGGRPWELSSVIGGTLMPLGWAGRFDRSEALTDEIEPVAVREGDALTIGHALAARGQIALSRGDLAGAARSFGGCTRTYRKASFPWFSVPLAMEGQVALFAGDWERARDILEEAARCKLGLNFGGIEESHLALLLAYAGDPEALPLLDTLEPLLPRAGVINGNGPWVVLLMWVEAAVLLEERDRAARLYPLVLELIAEGAVTLWACGLTARVAGIAAAAGGKWAEAESHFTDALRQAEELPYLPERAQVRYWHARMLLDRAEPGDDVRAKTLLGEAAEVCRAVGMPKYLEMVEAMRRGL